MSLDPTEQQRRDLHAMLDRLPSRQIETLHRQLESRLASDDAPDAFQRLTPRLRWPFFATLAALFFLYFLRYTAGGLTSWFSDDDFMNMHYYWSRPWTTLLKGNVLFFSGEPRPLGGLYYMAIHWIWGLNPLPYRVGALILISLNLLLLFLVVRELSGSLEAAGLSLIVTGLNE